MSQAFWNELQSLKARIDELEKRVGVPAPVNDVAERLERLERAMKGKR